MNAMQRFILVSVLLCAALFLNAQTPQWQWAVGAGGTNDDRGYDIATDYQGNQYVTGNFQVTAVFGPYTLTQGEGFIAKLDPQGNWLWAVQAGGTGYDIFVDGSGNAYLTGLFGNSANFGPYMLTSSGSHDIFAAKLDPNGNWLWAVRAGGTGDDFGHGIALDQAGNAYLSGSIGGTASFGPYTLTSSGGYDIFAAKLDPEGNWLWVTGASVNEVYSIAVDDAGNACLTGRFPGTVSFGPYTLICNGWYDVFAAKLDPNGNWLWAVSAGGTQSDGGYNIAVDAEGNIYLAGEFNLTVAFGTHSITSSGEFDIFAAKMDPNGNWLWAASAGGGSIDVGGDIAVDQAGNVYLTGWFYGPASFGPFTLTSSGWDDVFAAKLDPEGNWLWVVSAGGTSEDYGRDIAVDSAGNAYLTGYFNGTANFGLNTITVVGNEEDIFIAKLGYATPVEDELNPPVAPFVLSASPNPFAACTVIKADGDKLEDLHGNPSLDIYNLKGQKVRSLPITTAATDGFNLNWDGRDERGLSCPNGIYLARLDLGGRRATLKLSLVK